MLSLKKLHNTVKKVPRATRQKLALTMQKQITFVLLAITLAFLLDKALDANTTTLLKTFLVAATFGIVGFITEQGLNDHSQRKNETKGAQDDE